MPDIFTLENKIKQMIDEMKGLCQTNGLSNQASEEVVITSVFLYKFLNDKFMANMKDFANEMDMSTEEGLQDEDMFAGFYDTYPQDVAFKYEDTIECLINKVGNNDFYKLFDDQQPCHCILCLGHFLVGGKHFIMERICQTERQANITQKLQ